MKLNNCGSEGKRGIRFTSVILTMLILVGAISVLIGPITNNVSAVPDTHVWNGDGANVLASTADNWVSDAAPEAGDSVVFDAGSLPCSWDLALTLNSFLVDTGYTGYITTYTIIGMAALTLNSGTFNGSAAHTITCSGDVTIAGNAFITSNLLNLTMSGSPAVYYETSSAMADPVLHSFHTTGNVTVNNSFVVRYNMSVGAGHTLTLDAPITFDAYPSNIFTHAGTITGSNAMVFKMHTGDFTLNVNGEISSPATIYLDPDAASSRIMTLGTSASFGSTLLLFSSHATYTLTLDDGSNRLLNVTSQCILGERVILNQGTGAWSFGSLILNGTDCAFNQNGAITTAGLSQTAGTLTGKTTQIFTCSGHFSHEGGSLTPNVMNLAMTGAAKYLNSGTDSFYNLTISGTTILQSDIVARYQLYISSTGGLTISAGVEFTFAAYSTSTYLNLGVIAGSGLMVYRLYDADFDIDFGGLESSIRLTLHSTATDSRSLILTNDANTDGDVILNSDSATETIYLDLDEYDLSCESLLLYNRTQLNGTISEITVSGDLTVLASSVLDFSNNSLIYGSATSANALNAPNYLTTPTYDGSGIAVHPSVVYLETPWNDYQYWMAMTPLPDWDDDYENPSILASNDGATWAVPSGLTNPIIPEPLTGYNKDPALLYNSISDELWLYYMNSTVGLSVTTSSDGITWSDSQLVLTLDGNCPSVILLDGTYYLWYEDATLDIVRRTSTDGLTWGDPTTVTMEGAYSGGKIQWHPIVTYDAEHEYYLMLVSAGDTPGNLNLTLFFAYSADGLSWTIQDGCLINTSSAGWDQDRIHAGIGIVEGDHLRIWYDGLSGIEHHIGYTVAPIDWASGYPIVSQTRSSVMILETVVEVQDITLVAPLNILLPTNLHITNSLLCTNMEMTITTGYFVANFQALDATETTVGATVITWTVITSTPSSVLTYRIVALDSSTGYRAYFDGDLISFGYGASLTFTGIEGEYTLEVWNERRVSSLIVFTVNMVGMGIIVTVLATYIAPIARDIQEKRPVRPEKLTQNLIRTVIFIIVATLMWGVLHSIAIG